MEPLTKEKLEEVKTFAENLGFKVLISESGSCACFDTFLSNVNISVDYTTRVDYAPFPELKRIAEVKIYFNIDEDEKSDKIEYLSIDETTEFIKYMGYAVEIAERLKEA